MGGSIAAGEAGLNIAPMCHRQTENHVLKALCHCLISAPCKSGIIEPNLNLGNTLIVTTVSILMLTEDAAAQRLSQISLLLQQDRDHI